MSENRSKERYVAERSIAGSFCSASVTLQDIAKDGVQIEHSNPLRVATKGRLAFSGVGTEVVVVQGIVIWSRLLPAPNESGKYLYRSGIRIEDQEEIMLAAIQRLLGRGLLWHNDQSLDRKREALLERHREKSRHLYLRPIVREEGSSEDQFLLIQHARERLRLHSDEAAKWYNRAKFSLTPEESTTLDEAGIGNKEELRAVWEYLERSISLRILAMAFKPK
ncbi:MAG TPA: hypothetical protein VNM92_13790 [Thermoanaerobaculia bacterium]|nr:hypothetical protein [Thermoanaerobaculia bacterium]